MELKFRDDGAWRWNLYDLVTPGGRVLTLQARMTSGASFGFDVTEFVYFLSWNEGSMVALMTFLGTALPGPSPSRL